MRGSSVALLGTLLSSGCPSLGAYFCSGDDDCDRGGQPGVCLADNTCAYPDTTGECQSGLVRSPNADRDPGGCVPATPPGTGTGSAPMPGTGDVTTSGAASSTGGESSSESTDESDDAASSSGDGPSQCPSVMVTIDTGVLSTSEALVGYPLLVRLDDPELAAQLHANVDTLQILDPTDVALAYEVVPSAVDADAFSAWVRLGEYRAGASLGLSLRWQGSPPASPPTAVWEDRYAGVWHFDDALAGVDDTEVQNSAAPGEPGLTRGEMAADQSTPLVVGHGIAFDGVDDSVDIDAAFVGQLSSYTISMWARMDEEFGEPQSSYFQRLNGDFFYPRCWRLIGGGIFCQSKTAKSSVVPIVPGLMHPQGTTLLLTLSRDGEARQTSVYIDGELRDTTDDLDGDFAAGDLSFQVGTGEWGSATATIDEVRVSQEALPAAWIAADYATMNDPAATLESVGAVASVPCG
ncbi:MAG: LamG-like jellyroll fold domain-containing protein [Myxococcota bacterium]